MAPKDKKDKKDVEEHTSYKKDQCNFLTQMKHLKPGDTAFHEKAKLLEEYKAAQKGEAKARTQQLNQCLLLELRQVSLRSG
jgi:hypothetical protein